MAREHPLILQLDVAGNPLDWITYEDAAYYYAKNLVAWTPTEEGFTIYGGENRLTGLTSSMDMNTIIATKGEIGPRAQFRVPSLQNMWLFRRDQNICAYCGNDYKNDDLTRDHVHPRSRGGRDVWTNVVTACGSCNKHKDARTPEEANMKLLYLPYAPSRSEYLVLKNRNILADQMEFLKSKVSKDSRLLNPFKRQ
jgi:hypothetical protein